VSGGAGASPLARSEALTPDGRRLLLYGRAGRPVRYEAPAGAAARPAVELRWNELRGEHVVLAAHRQERTFLPDARTCPLCPPPPGAAPTEIPFESFELAVFENRFPSFVPPEGAAEVVVYGDEHAGSFATLSAARAEALMWVWRDRCAELGAREGVEYVMPFENRGVEVGVTLHHPHGQVYAFPFVPPVIEAERRADERLGGCAVCSETEEAGRIVHSTVSTVAHVPYAARWPYEVHVALLEHRGDLSECSTEELRDLAAALQAVTRGYDALFARPFPYVLCVHPGSHLHVELYSPARAADRLKFLAGSELGAGVFLNDTLPETTAAELRAAIERAG
jgi:UDPglucose--hexose-1-phosphate uridylyltransferase